MSKKGFIGFRLEHDLLKKIENEAKLQERSKSNLIKLALKQYLESKKQNK